MLTPMDPTKWADALEKIDKISARLLAGILLAGLILQLGPCFEPFRRDNEKWFPHALLLFSCIVAMRCLWWVVVRIRARGEQRQALAALSDELHALSPQEAVLMLEALSNEQKTVICDHYDPGASALRAKGFASATDPTEHRYPLMIEGWVWQFLVADRDRWLDLLRERAGTCRKHD